MKIDEKERAFTLVFLPNNEIHTFVNPEGKREYGTQSPVS